MSPSKRRKHLLRLLLVVVVATILAHLASRYLRRFPASAAGPTPSPSHVLHVSTL